MRHLILAIALMGVVGAIAQSNMTYSSDIALQYKEKKSFSQNADSEYSGGGTIVTEGDMLTADSENPEKLINRIAVYDDRGILVINSVGCGGQVCSTSIASLPKGVYYVVVTATDNFVFSDFIWK